MSIYTKSGDAGKTSLVGGSRVFKNHPRVEAYGDVDELISHLGLLRVELPKEFDLTLRRIQENLMLGSAHLAADKPSAKLKNMTESEILDLEMKIDEMTEVMPALSAFVLPSSPRESALCHVARTVCRRAERSSISIEDDSDNVALVIRYLNRLSDYLFTLARYQCHIKNILEDFWLP